MKKTILQLSLVVLAGLFCFNQAIAQGPLSGTYTVGSQTSDSFSSISQCVDSLEMRGINGAVQVQIDTGIFIEQVEISTIAGLSSTNSITFKGKGNETVVQFTPITSNRAVISVNGISHIIFDSFKVQALGNYGIGFNLLGQADSITIQNCYIQLPNTNSTYACTGIANYSANDGTGVSVTKEVVIINDSIESGYLGVRLHGDLIVTNNLQIENNTIFDFGFLGISVSSTNGILIKGNRIASSSANAKSAITMWPTGINNSIISNDVSLGSNVNHTRVIQVGNAPGGGGSAWGEQNLVANNMVRYHGTFANNMTGIYTKHVNYLKIYNNTVQMDAGSGSKSIWLDALSATGNIDVKNNNLTNDVANGELLRVS